MNVTMSTRYSQEQIGFLSISYFTLHFCNYPQAPSSVSYNHPLFVDSLQRAPSSTAIAQILVNFKCLLHQFPSPAAQSAPS